MKMTDIEFDFWDRVQSGYYRAKSIKFDYKGYEEELLDQLNNTPLTKADYDLALEKIKERVKDLKTQHLLQDRIETGRLLGEFWIDCEEEFGFSDFPDEVKEFIHGKAYEEGHAYGFSEIANKYDDLVEFANVCKEAFSK
jgi:hypothetical protein